MNWNGKPYYSLDSYLKEVFGEKIYKIALDGGFTCPNRDGTLGTGGCIFCSAGGSGDFAIPMQLNTKEEKQQLLLSQMDAKIQAGRNLFHGKKTGDKFIAYFQAYTNTYGEPDYLYRLYHTALSHPLITGISIATRPDCLSDEILQVFSMLQLEFPDKLIWMELGLQTVREETALYIRRGYTLPVFTNAFQKLKSMHIPVIIHMILGLPGEQLPELLQTINYINCLKPFGVKLQLLHVLKNTDLAVDYKKGLFQVYDKEHYLSDLASCICHLRPEIVVHRITGDGPKELLIAPTFSLNKRDVLNSFHKYCKETGSYQGRDYRCSNRNEDKNDTGTYDFI